MKTPLCITGFLLLLLTAELKAQKFNDRFASISPDGKQIVFESNRERPSHIFVADIDGAGLQLITKDGANAGPAWSTDQRHIIYSKLRDRQFSDVYISDLKGREPRKLTNDSSLNLASAFKNDWVYYTSNRDMQDQLRRVHINSNKDQLVISDVEHHNGISFSPDGKRAAIVVKRKDTDWDVAIVDLSTRAIVKEFPFDAREDSPQWSPDGNYIIFSSNRAGTWDIFMMKPDGSEIKNLTQGKGNSRFATWFPTENKLIFSSDRGGNGYRLFTMGIDENEPQEIIFQ